MLEILGRVINPRQKPLPEAILVEAWTGPEAFSRLRLPDFMTVGT
jgi:hypothetical protein